MAPNLLENLAQWNVQIALVAIAAAAVMHVLRIDAPVVRHAFWRLVLVTCLALPVLQPWRSSAIDPSVARMEELDAELPTGLGAASTLSASSPVLARVSTHIRANWRSYVGMFLAIGAILRLAWLLIGIHGLQRLRRSGERAPNDDEYDELVALIEAGAEIRRVAAPRPARDLRRTQARSPAPRVILGAASGRSACCAGARAVARAPARLGVGARRRGDLRLVLVQPCNVVARVARAVIARGSRRRVDGAAHQRTQDLYGSAAGVCRSADALPSHTFRSSSSPVPPDGADFYGGCDVIQENRRFERCHGGRVAGDWSLCVISVSVEGRGDVVGLVTGANESESAEGPPAR